MTPAADYVDHDVAGMYRMMDVERYTLICRMLDRPDSPDLLDLQGRPRGQRVALAGADDRWRRWLPRVLRATRERMVQGRMGVDPQEPLSEEELSIFVNEGEVTGAV